MAYATCSRTSRTASHSSVDEIDVQGLVVAWNATGTPTDMSRPVVVSSQDRLELTR